MDMGVRDIQVYNTRLKVWETRYEGWFVPLVRTWRCGHKHHTEEAAMTCARALLNRARRESQ